MVAFDAYRGVLLREREFDRVTDAMEARFAAEDEFHEQPSVEVVVLSGDDLQSLRITHARYFEGAVYSALADSLAGAIAGAGENELR